MLAHPSCINVIAQSMSTDNIKTKIQGRSMKREIFGLHIVHLQQNTALFQTGLYGCVPLLSPMLHTIVLSYM